MLTKLTHVVAGPARVSIQSEKCFRTRINRNDAMAMPAPVDGEFEIINTFTHFTRNFVRSQNIVGLNKVTKLSQC